MELSAQLLLSLSALGAINALFISIFFFLRKPFALNNILLGALLLMVGIRTFKSVLFYFNPELGKSILQIGLSACFLIGPLLYFYCLSWAGKLEQQKFNWRLHLAVLLVLVFAIGMFYPYQVYPELWGSVFYKSINYVWLLYLVMAGLALKPAFYKVKNQSLNVSSEDIWIISVYSGICLIWLAYYTASYTSYIVGAVSFTFLFYLLLLMYAAGMFRTAHKDKDKGKYINKKIEEETASIYIQKLEYLMQKQTLYKDANLTLNKLAKPIGISSAVLSQLLNDNLDTSFSSYVNRFRINAAKAKLAENNTITMDVLAEEVGFNSQSTFYSAFRKSTGTTPARFREINESKTSDL